MSALDLDHIFLDRGNTRSLAACSKSNEWHLFHHIYFRDYYSPFLIGDISATRHNSENHIFAREFCTVQDEDNSGKYEIFTMCYYGDITVIRDSQENRFSWLSLMTVISP